MKTLRVGARRSPLAVAQAQMIADALTERGYRTELVGIDTQGDTDRRHLTLIGGTGVFAVAVREGLLNGDIDVAVHSMKDLPTAQAPGLEIAAVPEREDTRDVLVGLRLDELADSMVIGTGSPRRQVQLLAYAASRGLKIRTQPIRGNVDTRLDFVRNGELNGIILAAAGLRRLGRWDSLGLAHEPLSQEVLIPAAAQGALAVEISADASDDVRTAVRELDHAETRARVDAERTFLQVLEAGCLAPVGVAANLETGRDNGFDLTLRAVIGRTVSDTSSEVDDDTLIRVTDSAPVGQASALGRRAAEAALAQMASDD